MSSRKLLAAFLLCSPLLLPGCGPTNADVIEKLRPQYDPLRAELRQFAAELPPPSPLPPEALGKKLDPKPMLRDDNTGNIVFFHARKLTDPVTGLDRAKEIDLNLGGSLDTLLLWTARPSYMGRLDEKADKGLAARLEAMRDGVQYLGVYRLAEYDQPVATDEKSYSGGRAAVDIYVYDFRARKLLAQWRLTARPDESVEYSYRKGEDQKAALESWARSTIQVNMRKALYDSLPEKIGGEYVGRR